jgi:hypothetical protein
VVQVLVPTAVSRLVRKSGFRFFFFSREGDEPPHIHVEQGCPARSIE